MDTNKIGFHLTIRYLAAIIMSFVIFLSFTAIFTLPLTEVIGYDAYVSDKATGQSTKVYTHYFSDGEDTKKAEYESQGLTVYTAQLRSELTGAGAVLIFTAAQMLSLVLFVALVPNRLYRLGAEDAASGNEHKTAHWLVPSLFPAGVSLCSYLLLVVNKLQWISDQGLTIYRYANYHLYGFQRLILGTGNDCSEISWTGILLAIFPAVLTIASCGILYELGYRGIHPLIILKNKIKYKRN